MFDLLEYIKGFHKIDNSAIVQKWEEVFNQMAVHTRKRKPVELLLATRPNEEAHIFKYRLDNYRAITYGSMNRALDSVSRILNKIQYNVIAEQNVKAYLAKKQFVNQNTAYDFYSYFEKIILKRDIEDPNGFLAWVPTGAGVTDDNEPVEPMPMLFTGKQIYDITPDVVAFLSAEVNEVKTSSGTFLGKVYYLFTKDWFYKLVEVSRDKRVKMRLDPIYQHNIGEIPVIVLGGDMNAEGYFESFFAPYNAFGDEAINTFSDWQAIKVTSGFPYTEEFYTECEITNVNKSSDPVTKGEEKYSKKIRLDKFPRTPYGTIIREIPGNDKDNAITGERILPVDVPSKRFISPDVETLKYSGEAWEMLIEKAEQALHLNLGGGLQQSGKAKEIDKEEHYAMIDKIANNYFNHLMLNSIKFIDCYINMVTFEESKVAAITPSAFRVKSEQDLTEELVALKSNKVPEVFLAEATNELAMKRFSGNPLSKKIFEVISYIDPLYTKDITEKQQLLLSGVVTKEMFIRSNMAYTLLSRIASKISSNVFIEKDVDQIKELFDEAVKEFIPAEEQQLFDPNGNAE